MKHSAAAAHHEAGHAVACIVLGIRFDSVFIAGTRGRIDPRRDDGVFLGWPADFGGAMMSAAGAVAEARHTRKSLFTLSIGVASDDFASIRADGHDPDAAAIAVKKLLSEHWHAVGAVAAGLIERGILTEAEVVERFRFLS